MGKWHFQDHLPTKTIISTWSSISWDSWSMNMQSRICNSFTNERPFWDHLQSKLLAWRLCFQGDLKINEQSTVLSRVTDEQLFKTIFHVQLTYWLKAHSVSWKTWTINIQSLPQCHQQMAFSIPCFKQNYCIDSTKLCLPGDFNNELAEASPVSPINGLFKTIFKVKLSAPRLCLLKDWNYEHEESSPLSLKTAFSRPSFE